jgi:hypothetical protein
MKNGRRLIFTLATILLLTLGASGALADSQSFYLTQLSAPGGFTGPYVQVTVTWDSSTPNQATLTYSGLNNGTQGFLLIDGGSAGANFNGAVSLNSASATQVAGGGFAAWSLAGTGSGNEDGFGSFNFQINSFDGYDHAAQSITFTVTKTSGSWTSLANVLSPNTQQGNDLAAHVAVCTLVAGNCSQGEGAVTTLYASVAVPTPEPKLLTALAVAMVGLAFFQARRRKTITNN